MHRLALAGLVVVALANAAGAAEDPNGTWKWSATAKKNATAQEATLKLKLDGDKLTGTVGGRKNQETPIENATYKDGEISFSVARERGGKKFTTKFTGKLSGDTIKGKEESSLNEKTRSADWEAKRAK